MNDPSSASALGPSSDTSPAETASSAPSANACPVCVEGPTIGPLENGDLTEASGIVVGVVSPNTYFTHDDSGHGPELFAIHDGRVSSSMLSGAGSIDWEDIARGPCNGGASCLYLADIGDNARSRTSYAFYRVHEPSVPVPPRLAADEISFTYPDGANDAEASAIDPATGAMIIVAKASRDAKIYSLSVDGTGAGALVAKLVGKARVPGLVPLVTAMDIRADGAVLLRTYTSVYFYPRSPSEGVARALAREPCDLAAPAERQGEAIAFAVDGRGYVTISEGEKPVIHTFRCEGQ
jgi:hypothetical protein